jgi:hypothetical protein
MICENNMMRVVGMNKSVISNKFRATMVLVTLFGQDQGPVLSLNILINFHVSRSKNLIDIKALS